MSVQSRAAVPDDAGPASAAEARPVKLAPRRRSLTSLLLVAVIAVLMGSILALFYALKQHDSAREQRLTVRALWYATQLNREAMRLHMAVTDALLAPDAELPDAMDDVHMRADIVASRVTLLAGGGLVPDFGEHLALLQAQPAITASAGIIARESAALDDARDRRAVLQRLRPATAQLMNTTNTVLSATYQADADDRAAERQHAYTMARLLLAAVTGLAVAMFTLFAQQVRQMRTAAATLVRMETMERDNLAQSLELKRRDEQATMLMREAAVADTVGSFNRSMNASVKRLAAMIGDIAQQCEAMNQAALAVREGSERAAASSSRAATHVADVARTAGQLSLSARDVSRKTSESLETAGDVRGHAATSGEAIRELTAAAAQIDSVTKLIASIASRTNLLALNATIEAARAGESGRGFAVVASEVKTLAQQTTRAVSDIAGQIEAIQAASERCVRTLDEIGTRVGALGAIGDQITGIVDGQTRAVEQVAGMIDNAATDTSVASSTARAAMDAADRANSAADAMLRLTAEVNAEAQRIRREIEAFAFPLDPGVPDGRPATAA